MPDQQVQKSLQYSTLYIRTHSFAPALVFFCSTYIYQSTSRGSPLLELTSPKVLPKHLTLYATFTYLITPIFYDLEPAEYSICRYAVEERLCRGSSSCCMLSRQSYYGKHRSYIYPQGRRCLRKDIFTERFYPRVSFVCSSASRASHY